MNSKNNGGFGLIDILIGTTLMLIVFLGIAAVFQLGIKAISQSKNKITATAIANQQLEMIRNLSYLSVGTSDATLPYANGVLDSATTTTLNGIEYTVETKIKFISDATDGTGAADSCDLDYKRADVKVSWTGLFNSKVQLITDIAPKDQLEEISACTTQPGGILSVRVFDAYGIMVNSPLIEVFDPDTDVLIDSVIPPSGEYDFPLATSSYKIAVSKLNYSTGRSYKTGDIYNSRTITTPEKPHPLVLEGKLTETSFSVDQVSIFSIDTLSPWGSNSFSDPFADTSKISESSNIIINEGEAKLATSSEGYLPSGYLISIDISPVNIISWDKLAFTNSEPIDTDLKYQIYYASSTNWYLVPDTDLTGNSTGFDLSPIDLANLSTTTYSQLKIQGNFSTNSTTTTPILNNWQVSWINNNPVAIAGIDFNLEGAKIVGQDSDENPIYKYSANHTSDSSGHINIGDMEWDAYTFSINPATGLDLTSILPSPQPISLNPNTTLAVNLFLEAENSLLATIQNIDTLEPIFAATVRAYNTGLGYDISQYTDAKGQTYFIPLDTATYNLEIEAPGYETIIDTIAVSGDNTKTIKLQQIE